MHQRKFFLFASFLLFFLFLLLLPYCSGPLTFYLRAAAASASATNGVFAAAAAAADFVRFGAGQLCFLHFQSSYSFRTRSRLYLFAFSRFYVSLLEAFFVVVVVCLHSCLGDRHSLISLPSSRSLS